MSNNNVNNEPLPSNDSISNGRPPDDDESDSDDEYGSEFVESIRSSTGLEIGCRVTWPHANNAGAISLNLSTCLPETAMAPLFDGTQWAGTRVWRAAVVALQYLLQQNVVVLNNSKSTLLELGCGLGVPGMILTAATGCRTVLTDKDDLVPQLRANLETNFDHDNHHHPTTRMIQAQPLDWSSDGVAELRRATGIHHFDVVLNCDCIFEPLYGTSWKMLLQCQEELLRTSTTSGTFCLTSCERRRLDGIEKYLAAAAASPWIDRVERVPVDFEHPQEVELYRLYGVVEPYVDNNGKK